MITRSTQQPTKPLDGGVSMRLEGVTKAYGPTTVLHDFDLSLAPGELICLLGPSGCGKTTALRCVAGLETVTSGSVRIGDADVTDVPANRRDIGMVFQQYSLFPHLSVERNVEFGLGMRRVPRADRGTRVGEMLDIVGLGHLAGRFPHELSGGQQQRVALARALVTRPRALLLDEPLSALDAKVRVQLRDQIRAIQTELGITTIFVTHDQEEALAISDRVAVMNRGSIAQLGSPEDLYQRPSSAFVADFVGLSNRMAGVRDGSVVSVLGGVLPTLPDADGTLQPGISPVTAYVRPENVVLGPLLDGTSDTQAVVLTSGFLGAIRRTVVQLPDGSMLASQHSAATMFLPGDRVEVTLIPEPVTVGPRS